MGGQIPLTSPGLVYLYNNLPSFLTPPAIVYIVRVLTKANTPYRLPESLWILLGLLSLVIKVKWNEYVIGQDAASAGAVLPPSLDVGFAGAQILVKAAQGQKRTYMLDIMKKRSEAVGYTFSLKILFQNRIFTSDPEYIKIVLATQFEKYEKGGEVRSIMQSLLGTGVFNSDGDMWKFHRAMTRPFFSKDRIKHFDIFDTHAEDAIVQLTTRLREGIAIDFQDLVSRFTLDSATEFLFGRNVRSLSAGLPYPHTHALARFTAVTSHPATAFATALATAQTITARRAIFGGHWPLREFRSDVIAPHMSEIFKLLGPLIDGALSRAKGTKPVALTDVSADREVGEDETLLDHLVHYTRDPNILRDEVLNILIAGRDTTAGTLTFVVYMLAEHPDVLRRVREEILSKVGSNRRPTYDDLRDMKFLRAVINETLRLYPPVPVNMRMSKEATTWPSTKPEGRPFFVPTHTRITYSVWILHRRKDLWGPDAEEFDPDRFIDERLHKYLTPNPYIFIPFNAGPRICLGQQFAYNEVAFFLVRLLQRVVRISLAPAAQPPESRPPTEWATEGEFVRRQKIWAQSHLTTYAKDGLWVTMEEDPAHDDGVTGS